MTGHEYNLQRTCRLCALKICDEENKYSVTNVSVSEFLTGNYENIPDFGTEEKSDFPKFICQRCYQNFQNYKRDADKHNKSHSKI